MEATSKHQHQYSGIQLFESGPYQGNSINEIKQIMAEAESAGNQQLAAELAEIIKERHRVFGLELMLAADNQANK